MPPQDPPDVDPFRREFPSLPIVSPLEARLSNVEKYGGLYYLGIAGLLVILMLVGWFGWRVWSTREVWSNVYRLHDTNRTELDRLNAALALSRSPDVNPRQLWEISLRKPLPPLARYLVAEGLTAEAVASDPEAFGAALTKSEGWPDWLRLILMRPLVYFAALGGPIPRDSLKELADSTVPAIGLLARFALAASKEGDPGSVEAIRKAAEAPGELQDLANDLLHALHSQRLDQKLLALDSATFRLRSIPPAAELWEGWEVQGNTIKKSIPATPFRTTVSP